MDEYKTTHFMAYRSPLAVYKHLPFQVITRQGACLITSKRTMEEAVEVCDELQKDKDAGTLPTNLSKWDKNHLLKVYRYTVEFDSGHGFTKYQDYDNPVEAIGVAEHLFQNGNKSRVYEETYTGTVCIKTFF